MIVTIHEVFGDFAGLWQPIKYMKFILVTGLARGDYDLLIGDITMKPERAEIIDFSVPFQTSAIT